MGLFTWIIVGVVILAIIGMGWRAFFSGVAEGAEKVAGNPAVEKATNEAREFVANMTDNATAEIAKRLPESLPAV